MPNIICIRAEWGKYTQHFLKGNYVGIGWLAGNDLSQINSRDGLYPLYRDAYPNDTSNVVIGQQVGQIARFLLELQPEDFVILPDGNTDIVHWGVVQSGYYFSDTSDGCPYTHRKKVKWHQTPVRRAEFAVPLQNTLRSSLTIFYVWQQKDFFEVIGKPDLVPASIKDAAFDPSELVLRRVLELDAREFEILITHLLSALGFEGAEHTGRTGDGGVDAKGDFAVANMVKVKVFVQAKRYQPGQRINPKTVKELRASIPSGGQGVFITTSDFPKAAQEIAEEPGFPRIGLVNGRQLVDLLVEHWADIPADFQEKLALKRGLVPA